MRKHLPAAILSLLLTVPLLIHAQEPSSCEFNYGTYSERTPSYVNDVIDYAAGVIDNRIYMTCGGGFINNPGDENDTVFFEHRLSVYDPETDTWDTTGAPIPVGRSIYGAGNSALDGKFYVVGGADWQPALPWWQIIPLARVDVYDPGADKWEMKANLPIPIGLSSACSLNGKIYVTGGASTDQVPLNTLYSYDPASDAWTELAGMITPREFHVMVALDGKLYAISGDNTEAASGGTKSCEVYDPATDQWSSIASLPVIRIFAAACAVDGEIYVFGGGSWSSGYNNSLVYKYNPQSDTWISIDRMPVGLENHIALPIGREIYIIGGASGNTEIAPIIDPAIRVFTLSNVRLDAMIQDTVINGDVVVMDLSEHFSHLDGGEITYSYCLDDSGILDASVDGSMLSVTGLTVGEGEVSILAESGEDQMGDAFKVNVTLPTGIDEVCELPASLHIYPNPAKGMTTLAFEVQTPGMVRLEVYDMLGKRSVTPLNEYRMPGEYEYQLNTGELLPGIYFCELTTPVQRITVKLVVEH